MFFEELQATIELLVQESKGILAADESTSTIGKRFAAIGVENTENNRRDYRLLLANTPHLEAHISGVILYEETMTQKNEQGQSIPDIFAAKGIVPGIKVDKGLVALPNTQDEQVTQGLDGLTDRLLQYKALGARFAKWRNVYTISETTPSLSAIKTGAENLARYAATCQAVGIVPIVEPEVLMDGDHTIDHCAEVSEMVLHEVFNALFLHQVELELMILKPNMITSGKSHKPFSSPEEIAAYTIAVFRNNVPAAVGGINFLSGGQSPQQATMNLNAINLSGEQPWALSFSYGRALQEECLKKWQGNPAQVEAAQQVLLQCAKSNGLAASGEYSV